MEVHRWNLERPKVVAVIDEQQPGQESHAAESRLRRVIALQTGVDRITRQCHALSILG